MMKCEELHNNLARLMFVLSLQERLGRAFLVVGTLSVLVFGCLTHVLFRVLFVGCCFLGAGLVS